MSAKTNKGKVALFFFNFNSTSTEVTLLSVLCLLDIFHGDKNQMKEKKVHTQFDVVRLAEVYSHFCEVFIIAPRLVG